jgi:hypothetical protein
MDPPSLSGHYPAPLKERLNAPAAMARYAEAIGEAIEAAMARSVSIVSRHSPVPASVISPGTISASRPQRRRCRRMIVDEQHAGRHAGAGVAIGVGVGAALGVATGSLAVWIAVGAAVGLALGIGIGSRR